MLHHIFRRILFLALLPVFILYYLIEDPAGGLMPRCVVKSITGWSCPGCGSQRFLHALLNGHPLEAVSYNYFIPGGFLLIGVVIWLEATRKSHPQRYRRFMQPLYLYLVLALIIAWMLVRNLLNI